MRIAKTDLHATDAIGVRRFVAAGDEVPPGVEVEDGDVEERGGPPTSGALGSAATVAAFSTTNPTRPVPEGEFQLSDGQINSLHGEALERALATAGIDAGSKSADEKREALRSAPNRRVDGPPPKAKKSESSDSGDQADEEQESSGSRKTRRS